MGKPAGRVDLKDVRQWKRAEEIARALRPTLAGPLARAQAKTLAKRLRISVSSLYAYRQRLSEAGLTSALLPRAVGFPERKSRLPREKEALAEAVVDSVERKGAKVRVVDVMAEVERVARGQRIEAPSRRAIERRLRRRVPQLVVRRGKEHHGIPKPVPGAFKASRPLEVVQIDHTTMDVMVVDDLYRQPLGRPYLSLALDVASRAVLATLVTFEPPSAATVALILTRVVSSKAHWLASLELAIDWPMAGLPRKVHLDNAPEFHSRALKRGCEEFGIELEYRPRGRPHFGGHIERLIGTLMSKLTTLPGATGRSTAGRKRQGPERSAALTLRELERWLAIEIGERYHHHEHRGLEGGTPYGAWKLHAPLAGPVSDLAALRRAFLPATRRTIQRTGVYLHNIRYWHDAFARWVGREGRVIVQYDPADLSTLYLRLPNKSELEVTYADLGRPAISIWECKAASKYVREVSRLSVNEERLFQAIERQRRIVRDAQRRSRTARRETARREAEQGTRRSTLTVPVPEAAPEVDYSKPVEPYPVELWPSWKRS